MEESRGPGRFDELGRSHPYLPKRVAALRLFAQTTYYKSVSWAKPDKDAGAGASAPETVSGMSKEECDAKVAELLSVLR